MKLEARSRCGLKRVPTASPAAAATRVPSAVPSQITAPIPEAPAIVAAATLLRMPPRPKGEVCSPIS